MGLKISQKWFFFMAYTIVQLAIERSDFKVYQQWFILKAPNSIQLINADVCGWQTKLWT